MTFDSLLLTIAATAVTIHLVSIVIVARRAGDHRPKVGRVGPMVNLPLTIIRPVSQADPYLHQTLESTFS